MAMRAVDAMRPADYSPELWRWLVERHARELIASEGFGDAVALAAERIEQQPAASHVRRP
jgi:hypothetical protein